MTGKDLTNPPTHQEQERGGHGDRPGVWIYMLLVAGCLLLVWTLPFFPSQDGPSHIYNLVILRDLLVGGETWGDVYEYSLDAVPNLAFHILAYPLMHFFPPLTVERIFISFYVLLLSAAIPFYLRTFGRPVWPFAFLVIPVLFNFSLLMGFYSFVITVPFMLAAISITWRIRQRPYLIRVVLLNLMGLGLYFLHLIPFCLFLMALLVHSFLGENRRTAIKTGLASAPLFLVLGMWILQSRGEGGSAVRWVGSLQEFGSRLLDLPVFSTAVFTPWQLVAWIPMIVLYYFMFRPAMASVLRFKDWSEENKFIFCLTILTVVIYLVFPSRIGGGGLFNQRLPWLVLLFSLPLLGRPVPSILSRSWKKLLPGIAGLFLVFNTGVLWRQSGLVEEYLSGLHADLKPGGWIMSYKPMAHQWARADVLLHAVSYYALEHRLLNVGNYEVGLPYFPVRYREGVPPTPSEAQISYAVESVDLKEYPAIEYLVGWQIEEEHREALHVDFDLILERERVTIWERKSR